MKNLFSLLSVILIGSFSIMGAFAQEGQDKADGPKFEFKAENNRIDLGTMHIDAIEEVNLEIEFENKGNKPLILSTVRACCGTQVRSYTEEPVNPGDIGVIEVFFRVAPRPHNINRSVLVMSNDSAGRKLLRIGGRVEEK